MCFYFSARCAIICIVNIIYAQAYLVGEPCKYDEECVVEHSYCEMQQICQCKENFVETEDRETCIAIIGAYCHSKHDCSSLPNSVCKENGCVCDSQFLPGSQNTRCLPKASHIEGPCIEHGQCTASFGPYSHCAMGKCHCKTDYHSNNGYCLQNKGLGQICTNSSECYVGESFKDTIVCSGGHCKCREGFHENGTGGCKSGSPIQNRVNYGLLLILIFTAVQTSIN